MKTKVSEPRARRKPAICAGEPAKRTRGVPTLYAGVKFRSRLEAKWAAFFDALGWAWSYEPIDLDGYIPDFILKFHEPLLVEVKPAFGRDELREHTDKIIASGWDREALIVGNEPTRNVYEHAILGLLCERHDGPLDWGDGLLFSCRVCKSISVYHRDLSYRCRRSGCWDGDHHLGPLEWATVDATWKEACNQVQWKRDTSDHIPLRGRSAPAGVPVSERGAWEAPSSETLAWAKETLEKLVSSPTTCPPAPPRRPR